MSKNCEQWRTLKLSYILASITSGTSTGGENRKTINEEVGVLTLASISNGIFNPNEYRVVSTDRVGELKVSVCADTLIISRSNTIDLVGTVAYIEKDYPNLFLSDLLWELRLLESSHVLPRWLAYALSSKKMRIEIQRRASGTSESMKKLSRERLLSIPLLVPPKSFQKSTCILLEEFDKAIAITEKLITAKRRLKQGLMQNLLTGKFRITGFKDKPWRSVKLGEVFSERIERAREDLPLLSVTGSMGLIYRDELIRRDTSNSDKSNYKRVASGDIVYNTMRMWQGVSALVNIEGIVSPAYTVVIPDSSLNASFIKHFFKFSNLIHSFHRYSQGLVSDTLTLKFQQFSRIKGSSEYKGIRKINGKDKQVI